MRESSSVVRPEPMGSATYSESSRLQAAGLQQAIAIFARVAAAVPLPRPPQPIVIADYGASTGHNSLLPIGAAIAAVRERTRPEHAVLVAHTDLPENDFTVLFRTLAEDPESYLLRDRASFTSAIGRSFYSQILPSNTVNLGWSSWATQWLSRVPTQIPDHLAVAYSADDAARSAFARQAANDWQHFVAFRARELSPEGRVVVLTMAVDEDRQFAFRPLLDGIRSVLRDLTRDGLLHEHETRRMAIPVVGRSEKDLRAPFSPSGRFEGLVVEQLEVFNAEDRFWTQFCADRDAATFGAQWAAFARFSIFPTLVAALDGGAKDPRAEEFTEQLEAGVAELLSAAPERLQIPLATVVLVKRGCSD